MILSRPVENFLQSQPLSGLRMDADLSAFQIHDGEVNLYGGKEQLKVIRVILHPDFVHAGLGSDVALLQLAESVQPFPTVKSVKLSSESLEVTKKDVCWVTGWGAVSMCSKFWGRIGAVGANLLPEDSWWVAPGAWEQEPESMECHWPA